MLRYRKGTSTVQGTLQYSTGCRVQYSSPRDGGPIALSLFHTLHCTARHCTALFFILQCTALCRTLHCTALYCTALYIVRHCTALFFILHCTALPCTVAVLYCTLHCTALHCTLHCTTLHSTLFYNALHSALYCTVFCTSMACAEQASGVIGAPQ